MYNQPYVKCIHYGYVPVRRTHTEGELLEVFELSGGGYAEIKSDYRTNQPFAVLHEEPEDMDVLVDDWGYDTDDWNPSYGEDKEIHLGYK